LSEALAVAAAREILDLHGAHFVFEGNPLPFRAGSGGPALVVTIPLEIMRGGETTLSPASHGEPTPPRGAPLSEGTQAPSSPSSPSSLSSPSPSSLHSSHSRLLARRVASIPTSLATSAVGAVQSYGRPRAATHPPSAFD
jgi:hypothetical protein